MKKSLSLVLSFLVLFPDFAFAENDLKIGFLGPLSGNAAILGADALPAIEIAIDEEKELGTSIGLFVEDDQYLTSKTVNGFKKLSSVNDVDVLILLTYGGLFALKDTIAKSDMLVIDTLDCDEEIAQLSPKNIICISKGTEDMGNVIAKAIIDLQIPSVSFIYFDGDPFMGILSNATKKYLAENSTTSIVSFDGYSNTTDFKSMLLKAKKAGSKGYVFYGYDELGNAMYQARTMGIREPFFGTVLSKGFKETAKGTLEGTYVSSYVAPRNERYNAFINTFKSRTGKTPDFEPSTFPSYDAIKILGEAVRKYENGDKKESLREFILNYFYSVKDHDGLSGTITIDQDGACRSIKNQLWQFKDGELIKPNL